MEANGYCMVITTVADVDKAHVLAAAILESRTAACVQWFAVESMYRWNGGMENDREILLQAKTTTRQSAALQQCIRKHHEYELPEIVELPIRGGLPEYLAWIRAETG